MQGAHVGHDHDPPRLRLALALGLLTLVVAAPAAAARYTALPSPVSALSEAPPLAGGAVSSTEIVQHRVAATTHVRVGVDTSGEPFAITATQTLLVRGPGDYFFTVGAPLRDLAPLPGSQTSPGFRSTSIVWQGFNPGRRTLGARATLDAHAAAPSLPLRIEQTGDVTTLVNATRAEGDGFTADALAAPLRAYLGRLAAAVDRGATPPAGGAFVTTPPKQVRVSVVAPLRVTGHVGSVPVDATITDRLVVHATGPLRLSVVPVDPQIPATVSDRDLLAVAMKATLTLARVHQYRAFLGNPDAGGPTSTTYTYVTAERPVPATGAIVHRESRSRTLLVLLGLLAATAVGLVVWARS